MGVDWTRKAEEGFGRGLQEAARNGFNTASLFPADEDETITYPCHWLHEDETLAIGTRLTIFQRGDKARIAVMHESKAVAEVRGEAARDLKEIFRKHKQLHNMLPVSIVRVSEPSEPVYVQPLSASKSRKKAAE